MTYSNLERLTSLRSFSKNPKNPNSNIIKQYAQTIQNNSRYNMKLIYNQFNKYNNDIISIKQNINTINIKQSSIQLKINIVLLHILFIYLYFAYIFFTHNHNYFYPFYIHSYTFYIQYYNYFYTFFIQYYNDFYPFTYNFTTTFTHFSSNLTNFSSIFN